MKSYNEARKHTGRKQRRIRRLFQRQLGKVLPLMPMVVAFGSIIESIRNPLAGYF
jgi:hypothetical protein